MIARRQFLGGIGAASLASMAGTGCARTGEPAVSSATPTPFPIREATIAIAAGSLYLRQAGETGPAVFLAHPVTGSAHFWDGQLTALAEAGYRAIAWSRRGHRGSSGGLQDNRTAGEDLLQLADALGIARFHAVGTAAGSGVMLGLAVNHPERLLSLTYACSGSNIAEESWRTATAALMPPAFYQLPPDIRELGPDYRAADPAGVARWIALEESSRPDAGELGPPPQSQVSFAMLRDLRLPALFIAGGADLYAPPALMGRLAEQVPGASLRIIERAGHSAYWEAPARFNHILLAFLASVPKNPLPEEDQRP